MEKNEILNSDCDVRRSAAPQENTNHKGGVYGFE
jgi:hypothetical protein